VAFVGVYGDDLFGRFMRDELAKWQIDISPILIDPSRQTGLSLILSRGSDRAILTHPGCIGDLRAEQVTDELLRKARHLHVASYFLQIGLQAGLPGLFRRAHDLERTISLDPNWDPSGKWRGFDALLPQVDVFLPNEKEAIALSGAATVEAALARLGQSCQTVAVKLGKDGAIALRGREHVSAPAIQADMVDTVGAGDLFDAGFLYGWLNGWDLETALRLGSACGSLSTRKAGGTAAQPTLEEARRHVL